MTPERIVFCELFPMFITSAWQLRVVQSIYKHVLQGTVRSPYRVTLSFMEEKIITVLAIPVTWPKS